MEPPQNRGRRAGVRGRKLLKEETDWRNRTPEGTPGTWEGAPKRRIGLSSLPSQVSGLEEELSERSGPLLEGKRGMRDCGVVGETPRGREAVLGSERLYARVQGSWGGGCREGTCFGRSKDLSFEQGEAVRKADAELRSHEAGRFKKDRKTKLGAKLGGPENGEWTGLQKAPGTRGGG